MPLVVRGGRYKSIVLMFAMVVSKCNRLKLGPDQQAINFAERTIRTRISLSQLLGSSRNGGDS